MYCLGCDTDVGWYKSEIIDFVGGNSQPCQIQGNRPTVDFSPEMVYLGIDWKYIFRDFSRFSEERPLPHVVRFEAVTLLLCVVTPLCAFGALEGLRVSSFWALKNGTDPVHGLIMGNQPSDQMCHLGISTIR